MKVMKSLSVRLPDSLDAQLAVVAEQMGLSKAAVARLAVEEYFRLDDERTTARQEKLGLCASSDKSGVIS